MSGKFLVSERLASSGEGLNSVIYINIFCALSIVTGRSPVT
jgi:hypothetical protein